MTEPMDTLSERMRQLHDAGWTAQFAVDDGSLTCGNCAARYAAEDVVVDEVYRFEGASDPADESILFAITAPCRHRGTLPATYGPDTPTDVADFVTRLRLDHH
ncbi:MAG: hypothetical protein ABI706_09055 [Ilumatobacteraceae bacterium]